MNANGMVRASHWLDVGQPMRCLDELDRAEPAELDRDSFALRARACIVLERWPDAVRAARRGLDLAPDDIHLLYLLALAIEETEGAPEAERLFLRCLAADPTNIVFLTSYAELLTRFSQPDKARRLIERAAELAPESIEVDLARMQWEFAQGNTGAASEWARRALSKDPDNTAALAFSGSMDTMRGRAGEGSVRLRQAATHNLDSSGVVSAARESVVHAHPLMLPVRLLQRLPNTIALLSGVIVVILAQIVRQAGRPDLALVLLWSWIGLVAYYWLALLVAHLILKRRR